jgi:DNA-binding transcriptional MocR family regulator
MVVAQIGTRTLRSLLGEWRSADGSAQYRALGDRIKLLILDGRLPVDTGLPAERDLAAALEVSRTLVTSAYRELRAAGYLLSVRGSGSIARIPGRTAPAPDATETDTIDFSKATMPPIPGILTATTAALGQYARYLSGSGFNLFGTIELRSALAERYSARGVPTTPEQLLITTGAQNAIHLLSRVLLSRGDRALVEMPSYPHAYDALRDVGARLLPVTVTAAGGWDSQTLAQILTRTSPTLGYLMPDFHNPTGASMPEEARAMAIDLAARAGTLLIADETAAELTIDRPERYRPFAAYAGPGDSGAVATIGSIGKTVWDGLRIGWIRADVGLVRKLAAARTASDLGTPILDQLIVVELLRDYESILATRAGQLAVGREVIASGIAQRFPGWEIPAIDGGVAAWINLGSPVSSQLALAARAQGLLITAGPRFGLEGALDRFLRIPIGYSPAVLERGLDALERAWATLGKHPFTESQILTDVV